MIFASSGTILYKTSPSASVVTPVISRSPLLSVFPPPITCPVYKLYTFNPISSTFVRLLLLNIVLIFIAFVDCFFSLVKVAYKVFVAKSNLLNTPDIDAILYVIVSSSFLSIVIYLSNFSTAYPAGAFMCLNVNFNNPFPYNPSIFKFPDASVFALAVVYCKPFPSSTSIWYSLSCKSAFVAISFTFTLTLKLVLSILAFFTVISGFEVSGIVTLLLAANNFCSILLTFPSASNVTFKFIEPTFEYIEFTVSCVSTYSFDVFTPPTTLVNVTSPFTVVPLVSSIPPCFKTNSVFDIKLDDIASLFTIFKSNFFLSTGTLTVNV